MSNIPNLQDDFKKVTYKGKRNRNKPQQNITSNNQNLDSDFNQTETTIRRIEEAKTDLCSTDYYDSVSASLIEGLNILSDCNIAEIICLGLGKIGECLISRYQFALLLCIRDRYKTKLSVFDPIFGSADKVVFEHYSCTVLEENLEGKYKVDNIYTIFYLPHCPKQLSNNLLWRNWGLNLNYCIIISNSFSRIIENTTKKELQATGQFISNISPYTVELGIINSFKFYEIFNDLAIHIFPSDKLKLISDDFWQLATEPYYSDQDIEFIRK